MNQLNKQIKTVLAIVGLSIAFIVMGISAPNISAQDIDTDYSIDQAIDRFGIDEDWTSFTVEKENGPTFLFQLDDDLQFQMNGVFSQ